MKLGAITDLLHSEKAIVLGALVVGMTVFVLTGHATLEQWKEHTTWLAGFYVGGKTIQAAFAARKPSPPADIDDGDKDGDGNSE